MDGKFRSDEAPRNRSTKPAKKMREIEFVNIHLETADKPKIEALVELIRKQSLDPVDLLAMGGYKISVSVDWQNECYIVSITGSERTVNEDMCVSSRSDKLQEALAMSLYKTGYPKEETKWEAKPKRFNWG